MTPITIAFSPPARVGTARDTALMEAAQNLETVFLAEMLQSAGLGQTSEVFGGGAGEDQFVSCTGTGKTDRSERRHRSCSVTI